MLLIKKDVYREQLEAKIKKQEEHIKFLQRYIEYLRPLAKINIAQNDVELPLCNSMACVVCKYAILYPDCGFGYVKRCIKKAKCKDFILQIDQKESQ